MENKNKEYFDMVIETYNKKPNLFTREASGNVATFTHDVNKNQTVIHFGKDGQPNRITFSTPDQSTPLITLDNHQGVITRHPSSL